MHVSLSGKLTTGSGPNYFSFFFHFEVKTFLPLKAKCLISKYIVSWGAFFWEWHFLVILSKNGRYQKIDDFQNWLLQNDE